MTIEENKQETFKSKIKGFFNSLRTASTNDSSSQIVETLVVDPTLEKAIEQYKRFGCKEDMAYQFAQIELTADKSNPKYNDLMMWKKVASGYSDIAPDIHKEIYVKSLTDDEIIILFSEWIEGQNIAHREKAYRAYSCDMIHYILLQRSTILPVSLIEGYADLLIEDAKKRNGESSYHLKDIITYTFRNKLSKDYIKKYLSISDIYNYSDGSIGAIMDSGLPLTEKKRRVSYIITSNLSDNRAKDLFEKLSDGRAKNSKNNEDIALVYNLYFANLFNSLQDGDISWLLVRKYTYCLSPIEAISIYGAKMNMDFIAGSIEKRMISYLDKQWLGDGIPFSVSQLKYFRAIVNTKNLDIQLPYKHIVDMVQRALDLYPYPTTDTIKYLVGFYDLLDDIHKAIVEPSLYKHCHREASFDHFRI